MLEAKQGSDRAETGPSRCRRRPNARPRARKRGTAVRGTAAWDTPWSARSQQAQSYARNLPPRRDRRGRPPFLVVVDVGQSIELYAEFSRRGGNYIPFPDPRITGSTWPTCTTTATRGAAAPGLARPAGLDPARRSAHVTREIAERLAELASSLEPARHAPRTWPIS